MVLKDLISNLVEDFANFVSSIVEKSIVLNFEESLDRRYPINSSRLLLSTSNSYNDF
jgi:hypothetical protein